MPMDDFRLKKTLTQYTSLLHFQGGEEGACLRASEVKPMLDRFVVRYVQERGGSIPESWKLDAPEGRVALRYKLHIRAEGEAKTRVIKGEESVNRRTGKLEIKPSRSQNRNDKIHPLYFGAMGNDNFELVDGEWESKIKSVSYCSHTLTILDMAKDTMKLGNECFTLIQLLDRLLPPFFALHCFGTRSGKGFGSFGVEGADMTPEMLAEYLPEEVPALYWVAYQKVPDEWGRLDDVDTLSKLMKSGFNYTHGDRTSPRYYKGLIVRYFLGQTPKLYSDKAAIKAAVMPDPAEDAAMGVTPAPLADCRYVRGLLGTTQTYEFHKDRYNSKSSRKGTVNIEGADKDEHGKPLIARFGNPIHFKPHGNYLFIIPQPIPGKLPGAKFSFAKKERIGRNIILLNPHTLSIPNTFTLDAFMQYVQDRYSQECTALLCDLKNWKPKGDDREQRVVDTICNTLQRVTTIERTPREGES